MTIYLDHNSTTPIDPSVADVIREAYAFGYLNPASQHRPGQLARQALERFRYAIADRLGASVKGMATDSLIFTSGGTESNNLAVIGLALATAGAVVDHDQSSSLSDTVIADRQQVLISSIEHPSVLGAAEQLSRQRFPVRKIPVDSQGVCRLDELERLLDERPTTLVSLMLANNETGVIQPVAAAAKLCRERGVLFHTDAVQGVGKIPVHFRELGVDAMTFTAHKFCGPRGIGGLILRHGVPIQPQLFGGFQQMSWRPGTEDVALVAGMSHAIERFVGNLEPMKAVRELRDSLQRSLLAAVPEAVVMGCDERDGREAERIPNTINIAFPGLDRQAFLLAADIEGLAISTGSACASGSSEPSSVLVAMGLSKRLISSAIRISLGVSNTRAEIDEAARRITKIINNLRQVESR